MFVQVRHRESGKIYLIPASQVVVVNDDGQPVSIAYERSGLIVCTDATQSDFVKMASDLKIGKIDVA